MSSTADVCARCSDNFIVNSKYIKCDCCKKAFHIYCVRVKEQLIKFKQECANIKWFCDNCLPNVDVQIKDDFKTVDKTKEILEKTSKLIELFETKNLGANNPLWSDIVKQNKIQPLIIKPKNQTQDSNVTKNVLAQKVYPADIAVSISKVKQASQGQLVIHCDDKDSLEKLKTKTILELGKEYEVKTGHLINPCIKIVNVRDEDFEDEEAFLTKLINQNFPEEIRTNIKLLKKYNGNKNKNKFWTIIVELSSLQYRHLKNNRETVYVGWNSYKFFEFVSVLRCYRCCRYGHKIADCKSQEVCPLCNKNHKKEDCSSTQYECANCKHANGVLKLKDIKYDHTVFDVSCPSYQKQIANNREKINYQ